MRKQLVLVGGGHAHLEALHTLRAHPMAGVDITLISPERHAAYTGMVPGMLAGEYDPRDLSFDLPALAAAAGARFVQASVDRVDGARHEVHAGRHTYTFDAASLNAGSSPAGADVDGMRAHAIPLRPLSNAVALRDRFDRLVGPKGTSGAPGGRGVGTPVVVVGGGAAGFEVAVALALRGEGRAQVTLVHDGDALLDGAPTRTRALAARAATRAGVSLLFRRRVARVGEDHVVLEDGESVASALTVWLAGAAPPGFLAASRLPLAARGFLEVDATLRATDGTPVWGVGDCAVMRDHPWVPRAGVYAVRQGAILAHNLRAALVGGGAPIAYDPQRQFLSLMLSGRDTALLSWRGVSLDARWARRLKRHIDLAFMHRHTVRAPRATAAT